MPLTASLKFLAGIDGPLVYVPSKGGGDATEHHGDFEQREVTVHDGRLAKAVTSLDVEGFKLIEQATAVRDFYDDAEIDSTYHREVVDLLLAETGASRIEIFDDTRRSSSLERQREMGIREPADIVHNDYTARSGMRRLRDLFADRLDEADALLEQRFAIVNVWRSIAGPITDHPLVLCDATTVAPGDLVSMERRAEERVGELQVALFNENQQWYFYPDMQMHEALLFKTFDSVEDGRTRFTIHSSFAHPDAPADAPPRESIETRCMVFFAEQS